MKDLFCLFLLAPFVAFGSNSTPASAQFDATAAERFAKLALGCVQKEYPNKISHVLNSDADVAAPRKLTPAFCGCYDWHSSVHGHWLLVRLVRTFPDAPFAAAARDALKKSLTAENLKEEANYLRGKGRASFERPYGLSWLLQLCAELREWDDPQAREMIGELASARRNGSGTIKDLAAEVIASGPHWRTRSNRFRSRPDAGLCAHRCK